MERERKAWLKFLLQSRAKISVKRIPKAIEHTNKKQVIDYFKNAEDFQAELRVAWAVLRANVELPGDVAGWGDWLMLENKRLNSTEQTEECAL